MKIRTVKANNHRKVFVVRTYKGAYEYPYGKLDLRPTKANPLVSVYADDELGNEAFTYTLALGR
ncbi:MAG: hypothetical protein U5K38_10540 [Woeseiaceae bacterium]|nr:hypothetical protein [Woeseiaceae bacterium]